MLSTGVQSVERNGDSVKITERQKRRRRCRRRLCFSSVGRKPFTEGLGLEKAE